MSDQAAERVAMGQGIATRSRRCVWCERPLSWLKLSDRWVPMVEGKPHYRCDVRRAVDAQKRDLAERRRVKRSSWGRGGYSRHRSAKR